MNRNAKHGLIRLLRKPVMYYGVGVLPIKSRVGKLVTRCVMNWSSVITVRDESSMGFLWQLKLRKNIIRTADLSLLLEPVLSERVEKKMKTVIGLSALTVIMILGLSYFLLPTMGIMGAGIGWLAGNGVVTLVIMAKLVTKGAKGREGI